MRTKKFRLLAVFLEATMLAVEDAQVEFELSIGKKSVKNETIVFHKMSFFIECQRASHII